MSRRLFTIGHSNHPIDEFVGLLQRHDVQAVADVRAHPYSKYAPHFSKAALQESLAARSIEYVFLGKELGARSDKPRCYKDGKVQYDLLSREASFRKGIDRVIGGLTRLNIALMCAERDPIDCHRAVLVARVLKERGATASHIHSDGSLESHAQLEARLLERYDLSPDMLDTRDNLMHAAYHRRGEDIAYTDKRMGVQESK